MSRAPPHSGSPFLAALYLICQVIQVNYLNGCSLPDFTWFTWFLPDFYLNLRENARRPEISQENFGSEVENFFSLDLDSAWSETQEKHQSRPWLTSERSRKKVRKFLGKFLGRKFPWSSQEISRLLHGNFLEFREIMPEISGALLLGAKFLPVSRENFTWIYLIFLPEFLLFLTWMGGALGVSCIQNEKNEIFPEAGLK